MHDIFINQLLATERARQHRSLRHGRADLVRIRRQSRYQAR